MTFLERFMPHGMCYAWRPDILWLHVVSDMAVAIAYLTIPFALVRKQEIEQRKRTETQTIELQTELAHMGRLTTMGEMATGFAHELTNRCWPYHRVQIRP